jgi:hypothetical protein
MKKSAIAKEKMKAKIRLTEMLISHGSFAIALPINPTNFIIIPIMSTISPAIQKAKQTALIIGFIMFLFFDYVTNIGI